MGQGRQGRVGAEERWARRPVWERESWGQQTGPEIKEDGSLHNL